MVQGQLLYNATSHRSHPHPPARSHPTKQTLNKRVAWSGDLLGTVMIMACHGRADAPIQRFLPRSQIAPQQSRPPLLPIALRCPHASSQPPNHAEYPSDMSARSCYTGVVAVLYSAARQCENIHSVTEVLLPQAKRTVLRLNSAVAWR